VKLHLNFRFDLRELDDASLAAHVQKIEELREILGLRPKLFDPILIWRGPIRHPWAYRFWTFFSGEDPVALNTAIAAWLASSKQSPTWLLKHDRGANIFLVNCELLDLYDELERRVRMTKALMS
jgi:hypothetical protein